MQLIILLYHYSRVSAVYGHYRVHVHYSAYASRVNAMTIIN
jgi:hypothetical protein